MKTSRSTILGWIGGNACSLCIAACSSSGAHVGGVDASLDVSTAHCTSDPQCSPPPTVPANCASGSCDLVTGTCSFSAKDEDGDQHAAANCRSTNGVVVKDGDDCNDHDPNLYPGHPEPCTTTADGGFVLVPGGVSSEAACRGGQLSCLSSGLESACLNEVPLCLADQTCIAGICTGQCGGKETQCSGNNAVQTCQANGTWGTPVPCGGAACVEPADGGAGSAACRGTCAPDATRCEGNGVQTCGADGTWGIAVGCVNQTCVTSESLADAGVDSTSAACKGSCAPGQSQCEPSSNGTQTCTPTGAWSALSPCVGKTCVEGPGVIASCQGSCASGAEVSCQTQLGAKGSCAAGTTTCTNGAWGPCSVQPQAVNCSSTADNDCNGVPDNQQTPPCACNALAVPNTQTCGAHPGQDGIGVCKRGGQQCVSTGSASGWGPCNDPPPVGPTTDTCSPASGDLDCDGIPGDGPGCYQQYFILIPPGESSCTINPGTEPATTQYMPSTVSNESDWTEWSSFHAWTQGGEGMIELRRCNTPQYHTMSFNQPCPSNSTQELAFWVSGSMISVPGDTAMEQLLSSTAPDGAVGYTPYSLLGAFECADYTTNPLCNHCGLVNDAYVMP